MSANFPRRLLLGAICVLACAIGGGGASLAQSNDAPPSAENRVVQDYRLGSDDKIRVLVYNEPDLSGEFSVGSAGTVALPLIGNVVAAGRTVDELKTDIQQRLAAGYLKSPQVSIDILQFRPYFILGEVNKPGDYPYTTDLTVLKAVATADGFTYRADKKHVYLKHPGQDKETRYEISSDLPLLPGDTIRIGERYF